MPHSHPHRHVSNFLTIKPSTFSRGGKKGKRNNIASEEVTSYCKFYVLFACVGSGGKRIPPPFFKIFFTNVESSSYFRPLPFSSTPQQLFHFVKPFSTPPTLPASKGADSTLCLRDARGPAICSKALIVYRFAALMIQVFFFFLSVILAQVL